MFFETEILTPNEKVKRLLKMLHLTQEQFSAGIVDRSLISKIINNREKVYDKTAIKIVGAINSYLTEENYITVSWLTEDENTQVNRIIDIHLEELSDIIRSKDEDLIMGKLQYIKELTEKYKIQSSKKLEIIDAAYLGLRILYKFDLALEYIKLYKEIAISMDNIDEYNKYSLVLYNCRRETFALLQLKEYHSIIAVAKNAFKMVKTYNLNKDEDTDSIAKITRNLALAYKKLGEYEKCIACLEQLIEKTALNREDEVYSQNLIAKCFMKLDKFTEAEEKLLNLERMNKFCSNNTLVYTIFENLCLIYIKKNNLVEAEKYEKKLLKININNMDKIDQARNLYYLTIIEIKLDINGNKKENIEKTYKKCFDLTYTLRDEEMQYKVLLFTAQYFSDSNMNHNIIRLVEFLKNNYKKIITSQAEKILNEISEYLKEIDEEKREEVISFATRVRRKFTKIDDYDI